MKILVIEPDGKKKILEIPEKEDGTTLGMRNRIGSCDYYYILDTVFNQTNGNESAIFGIFDTLSDSRREMFFISC